TIKSRIQRLERDVPDTGDLEHARAVFDAHLRVREHPEEATEEDRALAADWDKAFCVLVNAVGGLHVGIEASLSQRKPTAAMQSQQRATTNPAHGLAT